jgi:deoxyribose-phosphate aldolase
VSKPWGMGVSDDTSAEATDAATDDTADDIATARRAIRLIDLTDLDDSTTADRVARLCERAAAHHTAAVCVWPDFVQQCTAALAGSGVAVATVVNFPTGDERPHAVRVLTERALVDGAGEIDVVLPYRWWLAGDDERAAAVLDGVAGAASAAEQPARMKVILETGALGDLDAVRRAARFAIDHGADFVKTSTGKIDVSATQEAAAVILEEIAAADHPVGLKPSGGIRTLADARTYLRLADGVMGTDWATPATFRFGASGLLDKLLVVTGEGGEADVSNAERSGY